MNKNQLFGVILISSVLGAITGGVVVLSQPRFMQTAQTQLGFVLPEEKKQEAATITVLQEDELVIKLVEKTSPSVVSINVEKERRTTRRIDPFMDDFIVEGGFSDNAIRVGGGSGFFVSSDGYIVTNKHVIDEPDAKFEVVTQDGKRYPAIVVGLDPVLDLGFLKVEGDMFPALELGNSDEVKIGQSVIAIGTALAEFQNTVTRGIISGLNRRLEASSDDGQEVIEEAIQTDAAINPGNSGGPLIDFSGKVIGVNTAITDGAQSLGFALPSNAIKRAVESVRKHGRIIRPWIGVRYIQVEEEYAKRNQLPYSYGALILRGTTRGDIAVIPGSPADKAGLKENDLLLELNGKKLDLEHPLSSQVGRFSPDEKVQIKVYREGKEQLIEVTLEERKELR